MDSDSDASLKTKLYKKHEFEVREYLFTAEEIEEDVENQRAENKTSVSVISVSRVYERKEVTPSKETNLSNDSLEMHHPFGVY